MLVAGNQMTHKYSSCRERIVAYLNRGKREVGDQPFIKSLIISYYQQKTSNVS